MQRHVSPHNVRRVARTAGLVVLIAMAAFASLSTPQRALAATPACGPAGMPMDHCWTVSESTGALGANPDVTLTLDIGENPGSPPASAPFPTPFFVQEKTQYDGIVSSPAPLGSQTGTFNFDIQTNVNTALTVSNNIDLTSGQPPRCGAPGTLHFVVPSLNLYASVTNAAGPAVSSAPDPGNPPYTYDQEPDLTAGGVPMAVTHVPDWYAAWLGRHLIPSSEVVSRSYGIAKIADKQVSVNFITVGPTAGYFGTYMVLETPQTWEMTNNTNPATQTIVTCVPFSSTEDSFGKSVAHTWNCSADYFGNFVPSCAGTTAGTGASPLNTNSVTAGTYNYEVYLWNEANPDGDVSGSNLYREWDNCQVDANPTQSDANSNGIGDACKGPALPGGDPFAVLSPNWTAQDPAAQAAAQLPCDGLAHTIGAYSFTATDATAVVSPPFAKCQDAEQDGFLNSVDNCPLTSNASQADTVGNGVGDACHLPWGYVGQAGLCNDQFVISSGPTPMANCTSSSAGLYSVGDPISISTSGPLAFVDSNLDSWPDFLNAGPGQPCIQDHRADSNHDGYSDADEGTPSGAPSCTGAYPAGGGLGTGAASACLGRNLLGTSAQITAAKIAKADVDDNGRVNILDLSAAAAVYNQSGFASDPNDKRNEFDQNGDGVINILDLAAMAAQYNQLVPPC